MNFEAILFDCDGVLVDSEPIVNGVLRDLLEEAGWAMTLAECMATFVGKAVRDERALIAARTGRPVTDDWMAAFYARRNQALREGLAAIDGAPEAAEELARVMCAGAAEVIPDIPVKAEPCVMRYWSKNAETLRDDKGRLQAWPLDEAEGED